MTAFPMNPAYNTPQKPAMPRRRRKPATQAGVDAARMRDDMNIVSLNNAPGYRRQNPAGIRASTLPVTASRINQQRSGGTGQIGRSSPPPAVDVNWRGFASSPRPPMAPNFPGSGVPMPRGNQSAALLALMQDRQQRGVNPESGGRNEREAQADQAATSARVSQARDFQGDMLAAQRQARLDQVPRFAQSQADMDLARRRSLMRPAMRGELDTVFGQSMVNREQDRADTAIDNEFATSVMQDLTQRHGINQEGAMQQAALTAEQQMQQNQQEFQAQQARDRMEFTADENQANRRQQGSQFDREITLREQMAQIEAEMARTGNAYERDRLKMMRQEMRRRMEDQRIARLGAMLDMSPDEVLRQSGPQDIPQFGWWGWPFTAPIDNATTMLNRRNRRNWIEEQMNAPTFPGQ